MSEASKHRLLPRATIGIFLRSDNIIEHLKSLLSTNCYNRITPQFHSGDIKLAVNTYPVGRTPELLIVEYTGSKTALDELAEVTSENTNVILVGEPISVDEYRELLKYGIIDYIENDSDIALVDASIFKNFENKISAKSGRVVLFIGASGGVGTSTLAQNYALYNLESKKNRVGVIDLNAIHSNIFFNFDLPEDTNFRELLESSNDINPLDLEQSTKEARPNLFILGLPPLSTVSEMGNAELPNIVDTARSIFDEVVVDIPLNSKKLTLELIKLSDKVVFVAQPNFASIYNLSNLIKNCVENDTTQNRYFIAINDISKKSKSQLKFTELRKNFANYKIIAFSDHSSLLFKASVESKLAYEVSGSRQLKLELIDLEKLLADTNTKTKKTKFFANW